MNELIEQFLVESRELAEQATRDLLALEETPGDRERLDSAFRTFHTLKGGAGIVDFAAMERTVHAAEDALGDVRAGRQPVTAALIGKSLACIDQVIQWLDSMQADGEIPARAEMEAAGVLARFGRAAVPGTDDVSPRTAPEKWTKELLAKHGSLRESVRTAILYTPDRDCFLRGEDPLFTISNVPGLAALELIPRDEHVRLDAFDPFACQTVLAALSTAPADEVRRALDHAGEDLKLVDVRSTQTSSAQSALPPAAHAVLEAQILLLAEGLEDGFAGRLASAGRVGTNVLRRLGRFAQADQIEAALVQSQAHHEPRFLSAALRAVLDSDDFGTLPQPELPIPREEIVARSLRVDVARIDALVKLTGELTVVKNAIGHAAQLAQTGGDPKAIAAILKEEHAVLEARVAELQHSVLSIRVLPLRHVFQRFPRLVRELSESLRKPAKLIVEGEETEADKTIVEVLFEPLLHIIRNAVDHGIEPAGERASCGKPPVASIYLRAQRQGQHVLVEVRDDGAGIDTARLRQVAVARGVVSADAAAAMSDEDAVQLIFAAGFSTAAEVTGLSGRGVGMDAVRASVERLGGKVTVESRPGHGTAVRLTLPFSVMITRVMTVEAGGQVFGIPLDAVVETVRIARDRIASVGAGRAFVLRNRTVPVVNLAQSLNPRLPKPTGQDAKIVITAMGRQVGGIEVDRIGEQREVMMTPLEGLLAGARGISGTTLLGDGRVLIVLDVQDLLE
jgi:two-component system chemotaxis sensor kinase CheA